MSGSLLILAAALTAGGGLLALGRETLANSQAHGHPMSMGWPLSRILVWLTAIFLTAATLQFSISLVAADFSNHYVWKHTATMMSPFQRLTAMMAGQEGTFLFWSFLAAIVLLFHAERSRRIRLKVTADRTISMVLLLITVSLLLLTLRSAPFATIHTAFPELDPAASPIEGRDLNPVLRNAWMPIHTALAFLAYAGIGLVYAISMTWLIQLARKQAIDGDAWRKRLATATRASWILFSLALLSGVIWAYEETTFGWFWSWDPVETAALLLWTVLTASLHFRREPPASGFFPLVAGLSWVAVLFASYITRAGLHPSVHAFAGNNSSGLLGALLLGSLVILLSAFFLAQWQTRAVERAPGKTPLPGWVLLGIAGILFWGLAWPIASMALFERPVNMDGGYYTVGLGAGLVISLLLLGLPPTASPRRRIQLFVLIVALTLVVALIRPVESLAMLSIEARTGGSLITRLLGQASILAILPPLVFAGIGIQQRWGRRPQPETTRRSPLLRSGLWIAHAGLLLTVIGAAGAAHFSRPVSLAIEETPGATASSGSITAKLLAIDHSDDRDARDLIVARHETVIVEIAINGRKAALAEATMTIYPERDMGRHSKMVVRRGWLIDTQVAYIGRGAREGNELLLTVRRVPLINFLWAGMFFMAAGACLVGVGRKYAPDGRLDRMRAGPAKNCTARETASRYDQPMTADAQNHDR